MYLSRTVIILTLALGLSAVCACADDAEERAQFFHEQVEPILIGRCLECHGSERKGELDLRSETTALEGGESGACIEPGSPEESLLFEYVTSEEMPPKKPLTADEIATLKQWIVDGAFFPSEPLDPFSMTTDHRAGFDWWSLQSLSTAAPPTPEGLPTAWEQNPIDHFIFAKLVEKELKHSPPVDPRTLIRRVTYDVIGLPPTPAEVADFLAVCAAETGSPKQVGDQAYRALVDRLLASPQYGEHWGRHWLDAAGYADVVGSDNDAGILSLGEGKWRYRDYVVRSFNQDKPFDRFLTEQLAGDELVDWRTAEAFKDETRDLLVATGFLHTASDDTNAPELNTAVTRYGVIHRTLQTVTSNVLGLTVGCARCHSHKFDPIPQRDYYGLMAVFAPAFNPQAWLQPEKRALPDVSPAEKARIDQHNADVEAMVKALEEEKAALRTGPKQKLFAEKLSHVPEPIRTDVQTAVDTPKEKRSEVQTYLADKLGPLLEVTDEEVTAVLTEQDKAKIAGIDKRVADRNASRQSHGLIHAVYDVDAPSVTYLLRRGNYETPGPEVEPGFLNALSNPEETPDFHPAEARGATSGRRLALARWLTKADTPAGGLVARVRVNRDRKSTRLNSSHTDISRMPSSA